MERTLGMFDDVPAPTLDSDKVLAVGKGTARLMSNEARCARFSVVSWSTNTRAAVKVGTVGARLILVRCQKDV